MKNITLNNAQSIARYSWPLVAELGFVSDAEQQLSLPGSNVIRHEDENCFGIYRNHSFKRDIS